MGNRLVTSGSELILAHTIDTCRYFLWGGRTTVSCGFLFCVQIRGHNNTTSSAHSTSSTTLTGSTSISCVYRMYAGSPAQAGDRVGDRCLGFSNGKSQTGRHVYDGSPA